MTGSREEKKREEDGKRKGKRRGRERCRLRCRRLRRRRRGTILPRLLLPFPRSLPFPLLLLLPSLGRPRVRSGQSSGDQGREGEDGGEGDGDLVAVVRG